MTYNSISFSLENDTITSGLSMFQEGIGTEEARGMDTSPTRIFISHSHKDNDLGVRLVEDLRRVLHDRDAVWYDSHGGLHGGDDWWKMLIQEITTRNVFLVILSPDSIVSPYVLDEINIAWQQKNSPNSCLF